MTWKKHGRAYIRTTCIFTKHICSMEWVDADQNKQAPSAVLDQDSGLDLVPQVLSQAVS